MSVKFTNLRGQVEEPSNCFREASMACFPALGVITGVEGGLGEPGPHGTW